MSYDSGKSSGSMESFVDSDYYGSNGRNDVTDLLTSGLHAPSPRSSRRKSITERPSTPTFVGTAQIYLTATPVPAEDEGYIPGTPRPSSPSFTPRSTFSRPSSPCHQSSLNRSYQRMSSGYSSGPHHDSALEDEIDDEELLQAPPPKSSFLSELRRAASPLPSRPHFNGLSDGYSIQTDHRGHRIRPRSVCGMPARGRMYESPLHTPRSVSARPSRPLTRSNSFADVLSPDSSTGGSCDKCDSDQFNQTLERSYNGTASFSQSCCDHKMALSESEQRRHLLVDRLKEAQETIEMQAKRMNNKQVFVNNADTELMDLKNKEKELHSKIKHLEKERQHHISVNDETQRTRDHLQTRLETLEQQIRVLQAQCQVFQAESRNKQEAMDSMSSNMAALRQDNLHLKKVKETLSKEAEQLRQSCDVLSAQNLWFENNKSENKSEVNELRQENHVLKIENREVTNRFDDMRSAKSQMTDEVAALQAMLAAVKEEKLRLLQEIDRMKSSIVEVQSKLSIATMEKERHLQEKLELQMRIQNLSTDKQCLQVAKTGLEEQVGELTSELSRTRSHADSQSEATRRMQEELAATKKASEMLSLELSSTKSKLEKLGESKSSLEQSKRLAFQQHAVYEQEISSLEAQITTLKKSLENVRKENIKEKEVLDDRIVKLKEDLRKVKGERNQLEIRVHELESTIHRKEETRQYAVDGQMKELQSLQSNCDMLNTSLTQKNTEILSLMEKVNELDEECTQLRESQKSTNDHQRELSDTREHLNKLREENHRMTQERAENRQVIDLLEMQKSILEKTSECQLNKSNDQDKLQQQLNKVTIECNSLRSKVKKLQQEQKDFTEDHEDCVSKIEHKVLQAKLENIECNLQNQKSDYADLESRYRSLSQEATEWRGIGGGQEKLVNAERDRASLEAQVSLLKSQLTLLENSKQRSEDQLQEIQSQLRQVQDQHHQKNSNQSGEMERLRFEAKQSQFHLAKSRAMEAKLEAVIQSLKEELEEERTKKPTRLRQSLDEVGGELTQMRTELQTLLEVIQVKDQAIEDLENQLRISRQHIASRSSSVTGSHDGVLLGEASSFASNVAVNEKEREALTEKISQLTRERDIALQDSSDLREGLDDLQQMLDEEREKLIAHHQREMRAKDRQIESLEEQLQCYTRSNLKKLRRDAGRVDLLRAENKVLQAQLHQPAAGVTSTPAEHEDNPNKSSQDRDSIHLQSESLHEDEFSDLIDQVDSAARDTCKRKDGTSKEEDISKKHVQKVVQLLNKLSDQGTESEMNSKVDGKKKKENSASSSMQYSVSETMTKTVDTSRRSATLPTNSDPPGSPIRRPTSSPSTKTATDDEKKPAVRFQAVDNKDSESLQYISEDDTIQTDSEFSFDDESFGGGSRRGSGVSSALRLAESGQSDKQAMTPSRSSSVLNLSSQHSSTTSVRSGQVPATWPKFQKSYRSMYQSQMHLDKLGLESDTASCISQDNISEAASSVNLAEPQRRFSTPAYCLTTKPSMIKTIEEDREKAGHKVNSNSVIINNNNTVISNAIKSEVKSILGQRDSDHPKSASTKKVSLCTTLDDDDKLLFGSGKDQFCAVGSPNTRRKAGSLNDLYVSSLQNDSGVISQSGSESCESLHSNGESRFNNSKSESALGGCTSRKTFDSPTISTSQKRLPPRILPKPKPVSGSRFFNTPMPTKSLHSPRMNKPEWKF